jgi:hypothetical protein
MPMKKYKPERLEHAGCAFGARVAERQPTNRALWKNFIRADFTISW